MRSDEQGGRGEIEAKPTGAGRSVGQPMSWGQRVEQRASRRRAGRVGGLPGWIARVSGLVFGRVFGRGARFLRSVGVIRRRIEVDGVVYREGGTVSLRRALSPTGSGVKKYEVRFPAMGEAMKSTQYPMRESMEIRYTRTRIYHDLGADPRVFFVDLIRDRIRPGDRVLELGCGTGSSSAILAGLVGPSGGVVAVNRDGESIRFARQRHRQNHLAFELGWLETLEGELDGGFDAMVGVDVFRDAPDEPSKSRAIAQLWRVVGKGGTVVVMCSTGEGLGEVMDRLEALGIGSIEVLGSDAELGWSGVVGIRA
jgi:SAM-dependent methyltransferase